MGDKGHDEGSSSKMATATVSNRMNIDLASEHGASIMVPKRFIVRHKLQNWNRYYPTSPYVGIFGPWG